MGVIKIILIAVLIIAFGIGSYFAYSIYSASQKPRILSINIVDLAYEEIGSDLTQRCNVCFKGYYYDENNQKVCAGVQINGVDINDCLPHDILCVGPGIKSSFNLQIKNFENPIYCKVTSNGEDLTNPFLAYNGLNNIQDAYGEQLKQRYAIKVCCSIKQDLSNSLCSNERNLDARCLAA